MTNGSWSVNTEIKPNVKKENRDFIGDFIGTVWDIQLPEKLPTIAEQAILQIDQYSKDTVLYTDGSCTGGTEDGGAAVIVTTGTASNPVVLEEIKKRGSKWTCSYNEEKAAMEAAVEWIRDNNKSSDTLICSDSKALLTAIHNETSDTADIRKILEECKGNNSLQWVPAHVKIPGNELADRAAKDAAKLAGKDKPVNFNAARAIIKRQVVDPPIKHSVAAATYKDFSLKKEQKWLKSRKDQSLLAQLRSGHCLRLAYYKNKIDESKRATCPKCEEETQTVLHWMKCPATRKQRIDAFGEDKVDLGRISTPEALTYAKATLF